MKRRDLGLFVVPIRFNQSTAIYPDYLNFLSRIEDYGYTHLYIGEHLTDKREDIQSCIVFASAVLARTKKLKVALSVLPLTHYNIPLLIKQLEDLYKLSEGRLLIGFSQGALNSDLEYLGIQPETRSSLFAEKLDEFKKCVSKSEILSEIPSSSFFSTLLSPLPMSASKLGEQGYSALSSNFCHESWLLRHSECFFSSKKIGCLRGNWSIASNLVDNYEDLTDKSKKTIGRSLEYIYAKLSTRGSSIMLGREYENYKIKDHDELSRLLVKEQLYDLKRLKETLSKSNFTDDGVIVFNLFDCLDDLCYIDKLLQIPTLF